MRDLLYLQDDQIKDFIEQIFYAYRETYSDPKKILKKYSFGTAHHRAIHLIERYEGGLSQFKKINNLIKLSSNESALGPSPRAIEAFEREKDKIFKYPESDSSSLRDIISKKFDINSERIICGAGSDQIFDLICQLFIEPEDEVVVTEYGFIMHRIYASLYGAKVLLAKEKNFKASVDEILKKMNYYF